MKNRKWLVPLSAASIALGVAAVTVAGPVTPTARANPGGGGCGGSLGIQVTPDSFNLGLTGGCGSFGGGGYDPGPDYMVNRPGPPGNCCGGPRPEILPPRPQGDWVWNGADWVPPGDPRWWPQDAWYDGFRWVSVQVNCGC